MEKVPREAWVTAISLRTSPQRPQEDNARCPRYASRSFKYCVPVQSRGTISLFLFATPANIDKRANLSEMCGRGFADLSSFDQRSKGESSTPLLAVHLACALALALSPAIFADARGATRRLIQVGDGDVPNTIKPHRWCHEAPLTDVNPSNRAGSTGCRTTRTGTRKFVCHTIRVLERERVYYVREPAKYDPIRAYPLTFR